MKQNSNYLKLTDIYDLIVTKQIEPIEKSNQLQKSSKLISSTKTITSYPTASSSQIAYSSHSMIKNHQTPLKLTNLNLINGPPSNLVSELQPLYHINQAQSTQNSIESISLASQRNKNYFHQSHDYFQEHQYDKKGLYLTKKYSKLSKQCKQHIEIDEIMAQPIAQEKIAKKVKHLFHN